jgi:nicotinate-nucleotide adenylyltransferase
MGRGVSPPATVTPRPGLAESFLEEPILDPEPEPSDLPEAAPRRPQRIGVLGGTFDPPHLGHLWLATLAADAMGLERVLFMPAAQPPHKQGQPITSAASRLLMTRLAIGAEGLFELSLIEMERSGPSFTVDSVEELRALYADASLFLVMAADSLAQIDSWHEPDRLLSLIEWVVGPRPGAAPPDRAALHERFGPAADRIHLVNGPALDVSSSEIRQRVAAGRAIRYLVPRAVEELISEQHLYRP